MGETAKAPVDVFEKARSHDRLEQLEAAKEHDLLPYFRLLTSEAGPVVEMEGRETIMLGSNNYLGLTGDPRVKGAAREALETYGTGVTGSRLLNGTTPLHVELERELAEWMGAEDAIVYTTGYQANLGAIGTLLEPGDTVICDSGDHASILDGCRLSGAKLRPFRHNRMDKLEKMLGRAAEDGGGVLVVVDGVFSMEGDVCDLPRIVELCRAHGARLMVDEAHGAGVLGARGAGACELFGLEDEVDLRMGTFSKSLASCGGFVAGPADVVEYLRIASRSFVFSASAVPAAVGAALGALRVVRAAARQRRVPARGAAASGVEGGGAGDAAGRHGRHDAGRPGRGRRRLAGGAALEGALRRRRLHQRRDPPGGAAGRGAAAHQPDGDPRARAPRRGTRHDRPGHSGLPGSSPPKRRLASGADMAGVPSPVEQATVN
jgi:8-amino-7-oxononanoate synthase